MYQEEKTFIFRFSLEASFPDDYDGDADRQGWVREWETVLKPGLIKALFGSLRQQNAWAARIRNRGKSSSDEIEIVLARDFSEPQPFNIA